MKIVKIKNKFMFNSKKPNGIHFYALFWNKKYKKYNAIQLTHIGKKDDKRYEQADNGLIKPIRLKQIDKYADSGITKCRYVSDVHGYPLSSNIGKLVVEKVSSSSTNKIINFGSEIYSKGKNINKNKKMP